MKPDYSYYRAEGASLQVIEAWLARERDATEEATRICKEFGDSKVKGLISTGLVFKNRSDVPHPLVARTRLPSGYSPARFDGAMVYASPNNTKAGKALRKRIEACMKVARQHPTVAQLAQVENPTWAAEWRAVPFQRFDDVIILKWPTRFAPFGGEGRPNTLVPKDAVALKHSEYWAFVEAFNEKEASA